MQVAADVAAKVRGELEPQLLSNLHQRVSPGPSRPALLLVSRV